MQDSLLQQPSDTCAWPMNALCCSWVDLIILICLKHTRLTALCPGLPAVGRYARKVKPIWILLKQETVSGSGISWDICKSAPRCRQITTPAPRHSVFYRLDALPAAQPTVSKHWRHLSEKHQICSKSDNADRTACCITTGSLRYDTRCYFNVHSKADISQLNLPHGTDN